MKLYDKSVCPKDNKIVPGSDKCTKCKQFKSITHFNNYTTKLLNPEDVHRSIVTYAITCLYKRVEERRQ